MLQKGPWGSFLVLTSSGRCCPPSAPEPRKRAVTRVGPVGLEPPLSSAFRHRPAGAAPVACCAPCLERRWPMTYFRAPNHSRNF